MRRSERVELHLREVWPTLKQQVAKGERVHFCSTCNATTQPRFLPTWCKTLHSKQNKIQTRKHSITLSYII